MITNASRIEPCPFQRMPDAVPALPTDMRIEMPRLVSDSSAPGLHPLLAENASPGCPGGTRRDGCLQQRPPPMLLTAGNHDEQDNGTHQ